MCQSKAGKDETREMWRYKETVKMSAVERDSSDVRTRTNDSNFAAKHIQIARTMEAHLRLD